MTRHSTVTERPPVAPGERRPERIDRLTQQHGKGCSGEAMPDPPADDRCELPDPVDERYLIHCLGLSRAQVERLARDVQPRRFRPGRREWDRGMVEEWLPRL